MISNQLIGTGYNVLSAIKSLNSMNLITVIISDLTENHDLSALCNVIEL
jgi:hypothetical protein